MAGPAHPAGPVLLENMPGMVVNYTEEDSAESLMPGLVRAISAQPSR